MDLPIADLLDQEGCRRRLSDLLHPGGLASPRCGTRDGRTVHRRRTGSPVVDYRCKGCHRVFNRVTGTAWQRARLRPVQIVLILHGVTPRAPAAKLAREVGVSRQHVLRLRHTIQARALAGADRSPPPDEHVEADERYQNAGEEGAPHTDPADPPRRANQAAGHGAWDTERLPVPTVVGRESARAHLAVTRTAGTRALNRVAREAVTAPALVNTDEWRGYARLAEVECDRAAVNHQAGEWARDDDGDGVREAHCNIRERLWTGARNLRRPLRDAYVTYCGRYISICRMGAQPQARERRVRPRPPGCAPQHQLAEMSRPLCFTPTRSAIPPTGESPSSYGPHRVPAPPHRVHPR
jgi:transposase-like protein